MRKIKVLHVLTEVGFGGVEKYVSLLVRNLDRERFEVSVATSPSGARTETLKSLNVTFIPIRHFQKAINPINDVLAFRELLAVMRKQSFDIVHTHMFKASVLGRLAARLSGVKGILFTAHGFHFNTFTNPVLKGIAFAIEKFMGRYCSDRILTVSHTEEKQAAAKRIIAPGKMKTVYPGIEVKPRPAKAEVQARYRQELNILPGERVIGTVGRLARQKAPLDLVRAAGIMASIRRDIHVLFVGDGPLRKSTQAAIHAAGLDDRVHILGFCTEVDSILKMMDIFVLPSLFEGQPISVMEAMLNRVPVIASNVDGVSEIVKHNVTGFLVPPSNPRILAQAVLELLEDEEKKQLLVNQAEAHLKTHYTVQNMVGQIEEVYLDILKAKEAKETANGRIASVPAPGGRGERGGGDNDKSNSA